MWGITFRICPSKRDAVTDNLVSRERSYIIATTTFYPSDPKRESFDLQLFIADDTAPTYLGPASVKDIAWQIYHSKVSEWRDAIVVRK